MAFGVLLPARIPESTGAVIPVTDYAEAQDALDNCDFGDIVDATGASIDAGGAINLRWNRNGGGVTTTLLNPSMQNTRMLVTGAGSYLRIRGAVIEDAPYNCFKVEGSAGQTVHHIELDDCVLRRAVNVNPSGTDGDLMYVGAPAGGNPYNIQIWNVRGEDSGYVNPRYNFGHGIYWAQFGADCVLASTIFTRIQGFGIQCYPGPGSGLICAGISMTDVERLGLVVNGATDFTNLKFVGIVVDGAEALAYCYDALGANNRIAGAVERNSSGSNYQLANLAPTGYTTDDPLLDSNFVPEDGSSVIDLVPTSFGGGVSGNPQDYLPALDYLGNARATADAGAIAFGGTPPPPPPPPTDITHNAMLVEIGSGTPRRAYGAFTFAASTEVNTDAYVRFPQATADALTAVDGKSGWFLTLKSSNSQGTTGDIAGLYLQSVGGVLHWFLRDALGGDTDLGIGSTTPDTWIYIALVMKPAGTDVYTSTWDGPSDGLVGSVPAATGTAVAVHAGQNGEDGEVDCDYYVRWIRYVAIVPSVLFEQASFYDGTTGEFDSTVSNGGTLSVVAAPDISPTVTVSGVTNNPCGSDPGFWAIDYELSNLDPINFYTSSLFRTLDDEEWADQTGSFSPNCIYLPTDAAEVDDPTPGYWTPLAFILEEQGVDATGATLHETLAEDGPYDFDYEESSWVAEGPPGPPVNPTGGCGGGANWVMAAGRFFESPLHRFVLTDKDMRIITFWDRLAMGRASVYRLGMPWQGTGFVPSDNPEVNIIWEDDGYGLPYLAEGVRFLFDMRREAEFNSSDTFPWVCRGAGIVEQVQDKAAAGQAYSHFTAYDPWRYMYSRAVTKANGNALPASGVTFVDQRGDQIIRELWERTDANQGPTYIDVPDAWGGSGFYDGTIEETDEIHKFKVSQGKSVGQAWRDVMATGTCDIIIEPVYDPLNRPQCIGQISIYVQAGSTRNDAIFAWDMPSRSLVDIDRLVDGTQRANKVRFHNGQGGPAVALQTDATSVAQFGEYWAERFFPAQTQPEAVLAMAELHLLLRKEGKRTVSINPAAERSPVPLLDYGLGDYVPVYASNRFRQRLGGPFGGTPEEIQYQRVYGIPLDISDDALESVRGLMSTQEST